MRQNPQMRLRDERGLFRSRLKQGAKPLGGLFETLYEGGTRLPPKAILDFRDVGAATGWIVQWKVSVLGTELESTDPGNLGGKLIDRVLFRITDVEDLA